MIADPLAGCHVISLRPVGGHAALRRAAAAHGARVLALSPWRLVARDDAGSRACLRAALHADCVLFTSPAAVRAAVAMCRLRPRRGQFWGAVGAGTAAGLHRAGITEVVAPARMDSEGLLALPQLQAVRGRSIGLVTAPGGRNRLATALQRRGAVVLRADVYDRVPIAPAPRAIRALTALDAPLWLVLSSGEALDHLLATVPRDAGATLRQARVLAASARLAQHARRCGFNDVRIAASARPHDLLKAASQSATAAAAGMMAHRSPA